MSTDRKLPPLPGPVRLALWVQPHERREYLAYTEEQMNAYGSECDRLATLAEREKWHALMRQICDLSDLEMGDGDRARDLAAKELGFADYGDYCDRNG
jgi:hypothetical protein